MGRKKKEQPVEAGAVAPGAVGLMEPPAAPPPGDLAAVIERQPLAGGVSFIRNLVADMSSMPILANLLIEANGDGINISGTDLNCFGRAKVAGRVEQGGRTTAPGAMLSQIMSRLPEAEVVMTVKGARITIVCQGNKYQLATMPAENYPDWPAPRAETTLRLRQADLKRALNNTMWAMPTKDPRAVLQGVFFHLNGWRLECVATDGRKLGKTAIEAVDVKGAAEASVIVPRTILDEVAGALTGEGEIELAIAENQVTFTLADLVYVAGKIQGVYPKYEAVIPTTFRQTIALDKSALDEVISRAAVLAEQKHHSVVLEFSKGLLQVSAQSFDRGSYDGDLDVDYGGDGLRIAFNHQFLHDVFKATPEGALQMKVKENTAPVVFECESEPDSLWLLMPVRMADAEEAAEKIEPRMDTDEEDTNNGPANGD